MLVITFKYIYLTTLPIKNANIEYALSLMWCTFSVVIVLMTLNISIRHFDFIIIFYKIKIMLIIKINNSYVITTLLHF